MQHVGTLHRRANPILDGAIRIDGIFARGCVTKNDGPDCRIQSRLPSIYGFDRCLSRDRLALRVAESFWKTAFR